MIKIVVAVVLVVVGLGWMVLAVLAAGMADRSVDTWSEVVRPASLGLIPIGLATLLLLY